MKKIVATLLLSAAISAPAFAGPWNDVAVGSKYAVVDLGSVSYGSGTATTIGVGGGFQFTPYVGGEVEYIKLGTYSTNIFGITTDTSGSSLQFLAVGNYAINNEFSAYGKAGIAMNKVKVAIGGYTGIFAGLNTSVTGSSNDLTFAIGAKYKVSKDFGVRAQYQDLGKGSMNIISIGAVFNF